MTPSVTSSGPARSNALADATGFVDVAAMGTPQRPVVRKRQKNRRRKKEERLRAARVEVTVSGGPDATTADLSSFWFSDEDRSRRERTARHEAGHAVVVWLLGGTAELLPFARITIADAGATPAGVIPGGVDLDPTWFGALSPLRRGLILMAGLYAQDQEYGYTAKAWRTKINDLAGGDSTKDHQLCCGVADEVRNDPDFFAERVRKCLVRNAGLIKDLAERTVPLLIRQGSLTAKQFHSLMPINKPPIPIDW